MSGVLDYRKKSLRVRASQWFKNGDHPEDHSEPVFPLTPDDPEFLSEGKVVRYYRNPGVPGDQLCVHEHCKKPMKVHGWIDTKEGGHIVCPGDYIVTGSTMLKEKWPVKPFIFEATYEPWVEDPASLSIQWKHGEEDKMEWLLNVKYKDREGKMRTSVVDLKPLLEVQVDALRESCGRHFDISDRMF